MIVPALFALAVVPIQGSTPTPADGRRHTFSVSGNQFLLDGKPFRIRCGEMHYARVPREYWHDRFKKMKAMGLNSVCTYVFWNLHEPGKGKYDFSGNADVKEFVKEAQQEGLWVLLRPGPYSCAEWEWGGFPYWLANEPGMKVRTDNKPFLDQVRPYLKKMGEQLAPMQITHGGPILLVQVENEYGSFGHDLNYKTAIKKDLMDAGFDAQFYTADGPSNSMFSGGTLHDVLPAANFGGDPKGSFAELEKFRPGTPMFCGEFYPGWFDSWGKPHAHTSTQDLVNDITWMEDHGASYSLYMVHGGTTFGFMNGANWFDKGYWPQTTSYDYSTTIDESGRPTEKYWAFRKVIQAHLAPGESLPEVPTDPQPISIPPVTMSPVASLFDVIKKPVNSPKTKTFEELKQAYGYVLYRTTLSQGGKGELTMPGLQDRAQVFLDGAAKGTIWRGTGPKPLELEAAPDSRLDILVENTGRINYGPQLLGEHKGLGTVTFAGTELGNWSMYKLPFDKAYGETTPAHTVMVGVPQLFKGSFSLTQTGDTFLDMRAWGKGQAWLNGHNLGRYWSIGPQQTLFVPGPWLKAGKNELTVWELEPKRERTRTIAGIDHSVFEIKGTP